MSFLRPFTACDLFNINNINLDVWTETYSPAYYMSYLSNWGELFSVVESAGGTGAQHLGGGEGGNLMGYVMGKTEGRGQEWHAHVSAITVSPAHRRLGLASMMMELLEKVGEQEGAWFVDLFVRESNDLAIGLYSTLGYMIYRRVVEYYGASRPEDKDEDGFDMRKPLSRDKTNSTIILPKGITDGKNWHVQPHEIVF